MLTVIIGVFAFAIGGFVGAAIMWPVAYQRGRVAAQLEDMRIKHEAMRFRARGSFTT